jgi:transposase
LKHLPERAVLLFEDETLLRLFPVLRRAWSLRGEQAAVPISGRNEKRVLFGTINLRTGHRIVLRRRNMRQANFQAFLRRLRRCYPGRPIWLLLDEAPGHTAPASQALAQALDTVLVFLPKQCSELNGMDHLWREVKDDISANHQFDSIEEHADCAEDYILKLSNRQALRRAGILSKNFWLKSFLK